MLILRHIGDKTTLSLLICKNDSVIATLVTDSVVSYFLCARAPTYKNAGLDNDFSPRLLIIMRKV